MKDFELVFYEKPNGDCPVSEFLASLNKVMRFKMMHSFDLLELYGNNPRGDVTKFLDDGIFEVRAQNKTDISRILFFFDKDRKIVLTNGFIKKTQRLPASELETAKRYRADYLARARQAEKTGQQNQRDEHITMGPKWRPRLEDIVSEAAGRKAGNNKSCSDSKHKKNSGKSR